MNGEQNIDDILKLLKSSYETEDTSEKSAKSGGAGGTSKLMSEEELQNRLRKQFMSGGDSAGGDDEYAPDDFAYNLDDSILNDGEFVTEEAPKARTRQRKPAQKRDKKPASSEGEAVVRSEPVIESEPVVEQEASEPLEAVAEQVFYPEDGAEHMYEAQEIPLFEDDGIPPFDLEDIASEAVAVNSEAVAEQEMTAEEENAIFLEESAVEEEAVASEEMIDEPGEVLEEVDEEVDEAGIFEEIYPEDFDGDEDDETADEIFVENEEGELVLVSAESLEAVDFVQKEETLEEEETIGEAEDDLLQEFFSDENGQLGIFETPEEEIVYKEIPTQISDNEYSDEQQIALDLTEVQGDVKAAAEESDDTDESDIDDAMLGIMLEFGDADALGEKLGAERIDSYRKRVERENAEKIEIAEAFAFEGEEFEEQDQADQVLQSYSREKTFTLLRILGCGFFAVILFIYELFVTYDIETSFMSDYADHPAVFMLIGMQLLILSGVFAWRELWGGLKRAFTFRADRWSSVAVVTLFALIHSLVIAIISPMDLSYMFGSTAALFILFGLISEYIDVCRETKCFYVYSSEKSKFTVSANAGSSSSAEKMYRGGISREKKIFEPRDMDFPRGYFSAVNCRGEADKFIVYSVTPVIVMAAIALILSIMLGKEADGAAAVFMMIISALAPISSFAVHTIPMYKMSSRLYRRECAVAGEVMAVKYADCDYMVFRDIHLFGKARAEDCGIVIYDKENTRRIINYLDALYSTLGGPMKNLFGGAGAAHTVKLRRIARNGVEAVLDNAHILILGDAEFCRRYGISFPDMANTKEGDGILGFSIDGRPAAKLSCRYRCEPLFEMLAGRLGENAIHCAIVTYDPAINSTFVANARKGCGEPMNVIHKNANDFYAPEEREEPENTGLVVCSSRLKLIESVIWCKKFKKVLRACSIWRIVTYSVVCAALVAAVGFDIIGELNQYSAMAAQILCTLPIFFSMSAFPKKYYFSEEQYRREQSRKKAKKEKKKTTKEQ